MIVATDQLTTCAFSRPKPKPIAKKTPNMTAPARAASTTAKAPKTMQNMASRAGRKIKEGKIKGVSSTGADNDPPAFVAA